MAELLIRAGGARPWHPPAITVLEPQVPFFVADPMLGYRHPPGIFPFRLVSAYAFTVTNDQDGLRVTSPPGAAARPTDEIWIFGCSVTEGWSVNDDETFAWVLQSVLPDWRVVNFGVCGYGSLQSLLQFREALRNRPTRPRVLVLAYAGFHDERNTAPRTWRRAMFRQHARAGLFRLPRAWLDSHDQIQVSMAPFLYQEFPGVRSSALVNSMEEWYNRMESGRYNSREVARRILLEFGSLCAEHGIAFVVAGISPERTTLDTLDFCARRGLKTADIAVNYKAPGYNNLPHDSHPNARAHDRYGRALATALGSLGLVSLPSPVEAAR